MSNRHLAIIRSMDGIKGPARAVLIVMADRAADDGTCWPSLATLAKECGFSRSTVKNSLRALKLSGLISWSQRIDSSGDLTSNLYRLTLGRAGDNPPRAGAAPPRPGDGSGVGQELPEGRAGAGHKASSEAPNGSTNEASLFDDEISPMADSIPSKKISQQELAESIYQEYPKKTAKQDALKAILKAMKGNDPGFLLERTKAYSSAISWKDMQFIPYPATWFNKGHFNDDTANWNQPTASASNQPPKLDLSRRARQAREYPQEDLELP